MGWRPYYYGRWSGVYPWGWTWIGADPWAWPTHHFGRWGFSANVWFWIPGRTWGPAWVSWAYAPGYVSWCPLGWDNRAIFGINVFGGHRYDPWHAWTVVPHNRFGTGFVNGNVVAGSRLDPRTRGAFVVGRGAPDYRHYAVPRNAAPIYAAGTRAVAGPAGSIRTVNPGNFDRTGTAVPRGSIGSRADVQNATETFRNRGRDAGTQGSGFPPASRTPRDSAVITTRGSQSPGVNRDQTPNGAPAAFDRRAVPRNGSSTDRTNDSAPARRLEVPGFTRVPSSTVSPGDSIQPRGVQRNVTTPGGRSYAVPRGSGADGSAPRNDVSAPAGVAMPRRSEGYVPGSLSNRSTAVAGVNLKSTAARRRKAIPAAVSARCRGVLQKRGPPGDIRVRLQARGPNAADLRVRRRRQLLAVPPPRRRVVVAVGAAAYARHSPAVDRALVRAVVREDAEVADATAGDPDLKSVEGATADVETTRCDAVIFADSR